MLANTMDPDKFRAFVSKAMQERKDKLLEKEGLTVSVDRDLAAAISASKVISSMGTSP